MTEQAGTSEVACSLTDEDKRVRRTLARKTLIPHIIESQKIEGGLELRFSDSEEVRSDVELFARLERECCGFLTFSISPSGEGLMLRIAGPPEAAAVIESFVEQIQT